MPARRRAPSRGFSLLELLIVVASIAVLSGVAVGGMRGARTRAEQRQALYALDAFKKAALHFAMIKGCEKLDETSPPTCVMPSEEYANVTGDRKTIPALLRKKYALTWVGSDIALLHINGDLYTLDLRNGMIMHPVDMSSNPSYSS